MFVNYTNRELKKCHKSIFRIYDFQLGVLL